MIPVPALCYSALGPNGCSALRRALAAAPISTPWRSGLPPFTLGSRSHFPRVLHLNRREPERALSLAEAAKALAAEQTALAPLRTCMVHGAHWSDKVPPKEAIARIREGA